MVLPRSLIYSSTFRTQACRTARRRVASQSWRQIGRRSYASGHHEGSKKASSDLPWLIGSVAITVPSATWLWQQGPKKSDHHDEHGHEEHEEHEEQEKDAGKEDNEEGSGDTEDQNPQHNEGAKEGSDEEGNKAESEEGGAEGGDDEEADSEEDLRPIGEKVRNEPPNEIGGRDNKSTSGDEGLKEGPNYSLHKKSQQMKSVDPDADEGKKPGPDENTDKGHEGEEKGTRISEGDKKRKAEDPRTNSMHPYMADERKSKKSEGIVETAKLTGTVDSSRKLR